MRLIWVSVAAVAIGISGTAFGLDGPQSFSYQGRLFNDTGTAPLLDVVDITLGVYSPDGSCLLYEETQAGIDLAISQGMFGVDVGSSVGGAKRTVSDPGLKMAPVFANTGSALRLDDSGTTHTCGGGYSPSTGDVRKLRVTITPKSTGIPATLSPDQTLSAVPLAFGSETLQGHDWSAPGPIGTATASSGKFTNLSATLSFKVMSTGAAPHSISFGVPGGLAADAVYVFPSAPIAGNYLTTDAVGNLSWSTVPVGGDMNKAAYDSNGNGVVDNAEKLGGNSPGFYLNPDNQVSGAANKVFTTIDSGNLALSLTDRMKWDGGATGLVAANARTSLGLGTAATLNAGVGALSLVQLTAAAKLPAVDGSLLTGISAGAIADGSLSPAKLGSGGCSTSQILKWNGSSWICAAGPDYPSVATIWRDQDKVTVGAVLVQTTAAAQRYAFYMGQSPALNGNSFFQKFVARAGAYTLTFLGASSKASGKVDWQLDGVTVISGQDWFSAATVPNVVKAAGVTLSSDGEHTLKGTINGKNALSKGFSLLLTKTSMGP